METCNNCRWGYGVGGTCANPQNADIYDDDLEKPCELYEMRLIEVNKEEEREWW